MERLNLEQLARLVDEPPTPEERTILEGNPALRRELEALRSQTESLRDLPAMLPPPGGWNDLEKKLLAAGLIRRRQGAAFGPRKWLQAAAALVIFAGGTAFGWITSSTAGSAGRTAAAADGPASFASVEEAKAAVEEAARIWQNNYGGYQRLLSLESKAQAARDPLVRLAALETVLAASRAAVEESPEDLFLNGVFVRTLAERDEALRQYTLDNWH